MPVKGNSDFPVLQPKENVRIPNQSNVQKTMEDYAASQNSISAIGAQVAKSASNAMAVRLGYETGKNPQGDLLPPITEFDKNFSQSYQAQAQAVLTNQADKLLNNAHMEMSKATRITPDLIARTRNQLQTGLARIAENAPTEIKGKLETAFESQLMSNMSSYNDRMIREQRSDQAQNINNSLYNHVKNIEELASKGNIKGAETLLKNMQSIAHGGSASKLISPKDATQAIDTAKQAYYNGKHSYEAMQAQKEGRYDEYAKNYAEHPPEGMTTDQWVNAGVAMQKQIQFYDGLTKQHQSLVMDRFNLAIADGTATPELLHSLQSQLSEENYIEEQIKWIKANKERSGISERALALAGDLSNKDRMAGATIREKNDAFDLNVKAHLDQAQRDGQALSPTEAKLQVAMNAASSIPKYVNELNEKGLSNNPQDIAEAGHSIEVMYNTDNAQKLAGLDKRVLDNFHAFKGFQLSMPAQEAAAKAHETVVSKKPEQLEANSAALREYYHKKLGKGEQPWQYMLRMSSISPGDFITNRQAYAQKIQQIFESHFNALNGDVAGAEKITKMEEKQLFGHTYMNGKKQYTYLPMEKFSGIPEDGKGIILSDAANQLTNYFKGMKDLYDKGTSDFYYEVKPRMSVEDVYRHLKESEKLKPHQRMVFETNLLNKFNEGQIEIIKHQRHNEPEMFEAYFEANPYSAPTTDPSNPITGGWEVKLKSKDHIQSIALPNSIDGMVTYRMNLADNKANYYLINMRGYKQKKFANLPYRYKQAENAVEPILNVGVT